MLNCYLLIVDRDNKKHKYLNFYSNIKYSKNDSIYIDVTDDKKNIVSKIFDIDLVIVFPIKRSIKYTFYDTDIKIDNCDIFYIVEDKIDFEEIDTSNTQKNINF